MKNLKRLSVIKLGKRYVLTIFVAAGIFALNACAAQKALRFMPKSITKINYDPKQCTQVADGRFKCKDVIFTVATVDASEAK